MLPAVVPNPPGVPWADRIGGSRGRAEHAPEALGRQRDGHGSHEQARSGHGAPGHRSGGNRRVAGGSGSGHGPRGAGAGALPARVSGRPGSAFRRVSSLQGDDRLPEHDSGQGAGTASGRRGDRVADPQHHPLERDGDGGPRQPRLRGTWRAHRVLRFRRDALRRGLQPLLPRSFGGRWRRPGHDPGPLLAGYLRSRLPGGPAERGGTAPFPARVAAGRAVVLSAPLADAGLLAVPDRVDGSRTADGDLPGPLHEVPAQPRPGRHRGPQGVGLHGRRRDGRAGVPGVDLPGFAGAARQPDLRRQLQPAAAGRPGPRQRQDHPGARGGVPRRRLERDQAGLGVVLGSAACPRPPRAAAAAHGGGGRRRVPGIQGEPGRRLRAGALLRQVPGTQGDGRSPHRRGHLAAEPRRPRPAQDLRGLCRGGKAHRAADGHPGQDGQGLRHGRGRRGDEHHPPAEEDGAAGADGIPRPAGHPGLRRGTRGDSVLPAAGGQSGDPLPEGAPRGSGRLPAGADPCRDTARRAGAGRLRRPAAVQPRARVLDHDGVRAPVHAADAEPRDLRSPGADRRRRGAHLRHGGHVPAARHLRADGPALRTGRRAQDRALQGGPRRPDPPGGDQRGGFALFLDGGGDFGRQPRLPHDPVLHLLLDVRLPAGRRPDLGRGRHAGAGLPDRRHVGADDAQRRGPAAPGRPQSSGRLDGAELRLVRPDLRLRARGDPPGRPAADVRRGGAGLLLPDDAERELRAPKDAGRRRGGHPARPAPDPARLAAPEAGHVAGLGSDPARGGGRGRDAGGRLEGVRRGLVGDQFQRTAARRHRGRALEPPPSGRGEEGVLRPPVPDRARRRDGRGERLHEGLHGPDPRLRPGSVPDARHRRLRPQRHPRAVARLLRGRPQAHRGFRAGLAGRERRDRSEAPSRAIAAYGIDPNAPNPATA